NWPSHDRYGDLAGTENRSFLDADLFTTAFLRALDPYHERVATLIFEFGHFPRFVFHTPEDFVSRLDRFLTSLPPGPRYAVEIRNPEYLAGTGYLALLARRNVAHVLNAWTRMPALERQIEIPGIYSADFIVVRALLKQGRAYEQAVELLPPYN